ncbi:hypothetical protein ESB00_08490 [Oleiharenicola lentus]|uniref:3-keto-alpha-glucoside-1,2-lyase/3-keto-2-hydroxy-glucal hydratase domain-containing protein n=1 Tax=Oleiharenicola lentus TaxID=2508720 RepID=A0A4Q1CA18_9BACT|nr:family 16 glycoside hydrolase [Oleiharenicola lentus]RXK55903.1 hypothetical protein ESB00_08490 [Oleiharenicola lentus]
MSPSLSPFAKTLRLASWLGAGLCLVPSAMPQAVEPGELLLAEDFRRHDSYTRERLPLNRGWQARVAHGIWTRTPDGVQSLETPGHQPVLVVEGSFGDVVVELEFRYRAEPGKWAACRVSATHTELQPRSYAASVWANVDYHSRAVGLVLEHDQWSGTVTQVARTMTEITPDTWHKLRFTIVGDRATASLDGKEIKGSFPTFAGPKNSLWLATGLSAHELRRLRVYAARPAAGSAAAHPLNGISGAGLPHSELPVTVAVTRSPASDSLAAPPQSAAHFQPQTKP